MKKLILLLLLFCLQRFSYTQTYEWIYDTGWNIQQMIPAPAGGFYFLSQGDSGTYQGQHFSNVFNNVSHNGCLGYINSAGTLMWQRFFYQGSSSTPAITQSMQGDIYLLFISNAFLIDGILQSTNLERTRLVQFSGLDGTILNTSTMNQKAASLTYHNNTLYTAIGSDGLPPSDSLFINGAFVGTYNNQSIMVEFTPSLSYTGLNPSGALWGSGPNRHWRGDKLGRLYDSRYSTIFRYSYPSSSFIVGSSQGYDIYQPYWEGQLQGQSPTSSYKDSLLFFPMQTQIDGSYSFTVGTNVSNGSLDDSTTYGFYKWDMLNNNFAVYKLPGELAGSSAIMTDELTGNLIVSSYTSQYPYTSSSIYAFDLDGNQLSELPVDGNLYTPAIHAVMNGGFMYEIIGYRQAPYKGKIAKLNPYQATSISNKNTPSIQVFPNPTADKISIKSDLPLNLVELRDIQGLLLYKGQDTNISLATYPQGIYLLTVTNNKNEHIVHKVVKR